MRGTLDEPTANELLADLADPATIAMVADRLDVDYETVRAWIQTGKLVARMIKKRPDGVRILIDRTALRKFLVVPAGAVRCPKCDRADKVTKTNGDREFAKGDDDAVRPVEQYYECIRCDQKFKRRISVELTKRVDGGSPRQNLSSSD